VACTGVLFQGDAGSRRCQSVCPEPYLLFENWRCITKSECRQKVISYPGNSIQDISQFKVYRSQQTEDRNKLKCLAACPAGTKEAFDGDGTPVCVVCKDCPKKCNGDAISSLGVLTVFEDCTDIEGDLTIQLSGCEFMSDFSFFLSIGEIFFLTCCLRKVELTFRAFLLANVVQQLSKYLGRIRRISGFLKISRTFAIVSLDFFKSLEVIEGKNVYGENEYSLTILQNENLQKLFPKR